MLPAIEHRFKGLEASWKLASSLYDSGISINSGKLVVNRFEVSLSSVARELGINRKSVYRFIDTVEGDYVLGKLFSRLRSMPDIRRIAPVIGYEVLEAEASPSQAIKLLAQLDSVVEIHSFDFRDGKLYVIYEPGLDPRSLDKIAERIRKVMITTPDPEKKRLCRKCHVEYCPRRYVG